MIQFNLLPNVKVEYIKAQRMQRTVMVVSGLVTAVALFLFILLIVVNAFQKHLLNSLVSQVQQDSSKLQKTPNLSQILTVQNQLESLPALHNAKALASRLLGSAGQYGYVGQITPSQVTISDIKADFTSHILTITGEAPTLDVVNTYIDTLKFTTYGTGANKGQWTAGTTYALGDTAEDNGTNYEATTANTASAGNEPGTGQNWKSAWKAAPNAFSDVVLSSFGRDSRGATYTITLNFDQAIFSETESVNLVVPSKITTRSVVDEPTVSGQSQPLFQQAAP